MDSLFYCLIILLFMVGIFGLLIGGNKGVRLFRGLLGVIIIFALFSAFSGPLLGIIRPAVSAVLSWVIRILAIIALLFGIVTVVRMLQDR